MRRLMRRSVSCLVERLLRYFTFQICVLWDHFLFQCVLRFTHTLLLNSEAGGMTRVKA